MTQYVNFHFHFFHVPQSVNFHFHFFMFLNQSIWTFTFSCFSICWFLLSLFMFLNLLTWSFTFFIIVDFHLLCHWLPLSLSLFDCRHSLQLTYSLSSSLLIFIFLVIHFHFRHHSWFSLSYSSSQLWFTFHNFAKHNNCELSSSWAMLIFLLTITFQPPT